MKVLSLFDGMSCGQIALKQLGITPELYYASEIDKHAIKQTQLNFPDTIQLGDVTKWKEWDIDWKSIDLVLAGSPCFADGTKVITSSGYKNIEKIEVGDMVLTHKGRFMEVLRIGSSVKETLIFKAQGMLTTITTPNHPYYVRRMSRVWNNSRRSYERTFSEPKWVKVGDIKKDDFIGIPVLTTSENPENITNEEAFILGRYIADGHTRKDYRTYNGRPDDRQWQLIISVGYEKLEQFKADVKLKCSCYRHSQSTYRCVFSSKRLVMLAEKNCGCGASNKNISQMLLNLPIPLLCEVIRGYFSGDGSFRKGIYRATTVSRELAMSLCLAIAKAYKVNANIEYASRPSMYTIMGRTVNQQDTYTVSFSEGLKKQSNAVVIDNIVWMRAKEIIYTGNMQTVYNLEVANDNSYTANNIIVHNCQGFSFAGKQLAFDDPRSKLFFVFIDILNHIRSLNPDVLFLLENVNMKKSHMRIISEYCGVFPVNINSNLVSAQNRDRWYWTSIRTKQVGLFGEVYTDIPQPKDKGIFLRDILEDEVDEKYYIKNERMLDWIKSQWRLDKKYTQINGEKALPALARKYANWGGDYVCVAMRGREDGLQHFEPQNTGKTNCLTSVQKDNLILQRPRGNNQGALFEGKTPTLSACAWEQNNLLCISSNQAHATISINKSAPMVSAMGMGGGHVPMVVSGALRGFRDDYGFREIKSGKGACLLARAREDGSGQNVCIKNGKIRRLTPLECSRLQTIPAWYRWGCSDTQIYKMLGNGWTVDVIVHILSFLKEKLNINVV